MNAGEESVPGRRTVLEIFRDRLTTVIHESGMSRSAFAEACAIDRSTLSQLLSPTNRRLPRVETLGSIAARQQVSIDWLLGLTNTESMRAEWMNEQMSFETDALAPNDERLIAWLREAVGYKIRYVPSTLPDLLKTEAVIRYEMHDYVAARPEQKIETAAARLTWTRSPDTELECCTSLQTIESFARGAGIWRQLPRRDRIAQLDHISDLCSDLYPTLRWFLFDGRQLYAAPVTIFGPQRAALYLGQMYLVLTSAEHVRMMTRHFDGLIRGAVVQPPDLPAFCAEQRAIASRSPA